MAVWEGVLVEQAVEEIDNIEIGTIELIWFRFYFIWLAHLWSKIECS